MHIDIFEVEDDLTEIAKLFKEYKSELNVDLSFQPDDESTDEIKKSYAQLNGKIFIAQVDDEFAGCIAFHQMKSELDCEIKRLYVKPKFRGLKIGKILLEHAIKSAFDLGYTSIYLDTLERLKAACRMYENFGFKKIPPYYQNPLEGVIYYRLSK